MKRHWDHYDEDWHDDDCINDDNGQYDDDSNDDNGDNDDNNLRATGKPSM